MMSFFHDLFEHDLYSDQLKLMMTENRQTLLERTIPLFSQYEGIFQSQKLIPFTLL